MRKAPVKETIIKQESRKCGNEIYDYALIMSESQKVASYKLPLYSIKIDMIDENGKKTTATSRDLFADVGKALIFFRRLVDNLATPLNLPYILEDEMQ